MFLLISRFRAINLRHSCVPTFNRDIKECQSLIVPRSELFTREETTTIKSRFECQILIKLVRNLFRYDKMYFFLENIFYIAHGLYIIMQFLYN